MTQDQLFTLIRKIVLEGLARYGVTGYEVQRSYQGTKQGASTGNAVFFFPVIDRRIGSPKQSGSWDGTGQQATLKQMMEASFQVFVRNKGALNGQTITPTASDVTNLIADVFVTDLVIAELQAQNVGVLRVTEVRNDYEVNEVDRHEQVPFFDLTLSYTNTRVAVGAPIESIEPGIYRV